MKKFGIITLMGAPNAGKSTLLNQILGEKLSIVCHKRQTTRTRVAGIFTEKETQVLLIDTPGIFFDPKRKLEKAMISTAWQATFEGDYIFMLVDAKSAYFQNDLKKIMGKLVDVQDKVILILNKVDLVKEKGRLLDHVKTLSEGFQFHKVFMISAKTGAGVKDLVKFMHESLPEGEWRYPEDQLSDLPQRFLAAELVREVLLHELHEEIPYGLVVQTEKWEPFHNGDLKIYFMICLEKQSHKAIVLGKGGQKIKIIGEKARAEISQALGCRVHLKLHVKVDEKWQDKPDFFHDLGLDLT